MIYPIYSDILLTNLEILVWLLFLLFEFVYPWKHDYVFVTTLQCHYYVIMMS